MGEGGGKGGGQRFIPSRDQSRYHNIFFDAPDHAEVDGPAQHNRGEIGRGGQGYLCWLYAAERIVLWGGLVVRSNLRDRIMPLVEGPHLLVRQNSSLSTIASLTLWPKVQDLS